MAGCSGSNSGYEQGAREQGDGVRSGGLHFPKAHPEHTSAPCSLNRNDWR